MAGVRGATRFDPTRWSVSGLTGRIFREKCDVDSERERESTGFESPKLRAAGVGSALNLLRLFRRTVT